MTAYCGCRIRRLFINSDDLAAPCISGTPNRWGSDTSFRRILAPVPCFSKFSTYWADGAFHNIVSQDDADRVLVGEKLCEGQRCGDAAFPFLVCVIDVIESELLAVAEQAKEISGIIPAGDDQDVPDPRIDHQFDGIINHRLVVDGQQVFVRDLRQRIQPCSQPARQDDAFHELPHSNSKQVRELESE